jgi:hypothetical protein
MPLFTPGAGRGGIPFFSSAQPLRWTKAPLATLKTLAQPSLAILSLLHFHLRLIENRIYPSAVAMSETFHCPHTIYYWAQHE